MQLQISDLATARQWGAVIGFTPVEFEKLLNVFTQSYFELYGQIVAQRQAEIEVTPSLSSEEELLFFTLFSVKAGLTYDVLGFVSGMDASNAKRNQQLGFDVLHRLYQRRSPCRAVSSKTLSSLRNTCKAKSTSSLMD